MDIAPGTKPIDLAISAIASHQGGNISYAQLRAIPLSRTQINHRIRCGRLHRIHRGVFRVGHLAVAPLAAEFAAQLACGPESVIARRSALAGWKLIVAAPAIVDVLAPAGRRIGASGIRVHCGALPKAEIRSVDGLRVTSPALSILDSAADLATDDLEMALSNARSRHLVRASQFERLRSWQPRRRGWRALGSILDLESAPDFARSKAEVLAVSVLREAGFEQPRRNARLHGFEVDLWLPEWQLVVEVDGFASHGGPAAFARDRQRDAALRSHGIEVWRLTWAQLTKHRARSVRELRSWREEQSRP